MDYAVPKPWGVETETTGPTFNSQYPTEFRPSSIPNCGRGWFAKVDIPATTLLRTVQISDGTLIRFESEEQLRKTGWELDDLVNYGIGHHKDPAAIFFLKPGTAMNHADPSRCRSVEYRHDQVGEIQLWTLCDIKAGEEMFCNYSTDFARVPWYDDLMKLHNLTPLSHLGEVIDNAQANGSQGQAIHALGTNSKAIEDYYEAWGPVKYEQNLREWGYTATERVTKVVVEASGVLPADARVLDAGCGSGVQATDMQAAGFKDVVGIDIWSGGLDHARSRNFYTSLHKADLQQPLLAQAPVLQDNTFDIVTCVGTLTYIASSSSCLPELVRVCKPGGVIAYTNRTDKLQAWAEAEQRLVNAGAVELVSRSERVPYLPNNKEFGADTEIVITAWRKK